MSKYFYIIGTHDESDSIRIITRAGRKEFALEFIEKIKDGQEEIYIFESNEDKNHNALEAFEAIWFNEEKRKEFIKKELQNYVTTPEEGDNNEGEKMQNVQEISKALTMIANGFHLLAQNYSSVQLNAETVAVIEEPKKEEKVKKTKPAKPAEVKAEEVVAQEDDFSDFDFTGEEEKVAYTVEDIRAACISHAKKNTKEKTYEILKEFGAKSPNDIKAEKYNEVMTKLAV
jgi:hypothetical protein